MLKIARAIDKCSGSDGIHSTLIEGVHCFKLSKPDDQLPAIYRPSIYVVAQGAKKAVLENEVYSYSSGQFLLVSVDLPLIGQVVEASPDAPYLCAQIDLDSALMSDLALKLNANNHIENPTERGLFVGDINDGLKGVVWRLFQLLETPQDIPYLAPLIIEEFHYRLLVGAYGASIRKACAPDGGMHRIASVITSIKSDLAKPVVINELAAIANMSPSNFHTQFKNVTTYSPLQYVKRLRLTQARQIMLTGRTNVASTSRMVGYESPSHFSRDYAQLFGAPPKRDIDSLRFRENSPGSSGSSDIGR